LTGECFLSRSASEAWSGGSPGEEANHPVEPATILQESHRSTQGPVQEKVDRQERGIDLDGRRQEPIIDLATDLRQNALRAAVRGQRAKAA